MLRVRALSKSAELINGGRSQAVWTRVPILGVHGRRIPQGHDVRRRETKSRTELTGYTVIAYLYIRYLPVAARTRVGLSRCSPGVIGYTSIMSKEQQYIPECLLESSGQGMESVVGTRFVERSVHDHTAPVPLDQILSKRRTVSVAPP
jgi:hypothetical protein